MDSYSRTFFQKHDVASLGPLGHYTRGPAHAGRPRVSVTDASVAPHNADLGSTSTVAEGSRSDISTVLYSQLKSPLYFSETARRVIILTYLLLLTYDEQPGLFLWIPVRHRMPNPNPNPNPSYAGPSLWRPFAMAGRYRSCEKPRAPVSITESILSTFY